MKLLNVSLATVVVAVGFWLLWGTHYPAVLIMWTLTVGSFLWWRARTVTQIWAWSTLLLGLESFAWPLLLMIELQSSSGSPSEDQMGWILSAVVLGLLSSVFWISFSYGLYKRDQTMSETAAPAGAPQPGLPRSAKRPVRR